MTRLWMQFVLAGRQLRRSPGLAVIAMLTLALGIGSTTAIFSLFDQVMLRALPVSGAQQLVRLHWSGNFSGNMRIFGGDAESYFSYPEYQQLNRQTQIFRGVLGATQATFGLSVEGQNRIADGELVSGNYFRVLGLKPALGRLFTAADETAKDANHAGASQ